MIELPLFPLNTVLFPKTPLHLHIFEERYKRMIGRCAEEHTPFGVVLIRSGREALGPLAEPYEIGCTTRIMNIQQIEGGRMNIVTLGEDRFRIHSLDARSQPYLQGVVETAPIQTGPEDALVEPGAALRRQIERYIEALLNAGATFDIRQLPESPIDLAYLAAALLQIDSAEKQRLLEVDDAPRLIATIRSLISREQALLAAMLNHHERSRHNKGSFSPN